MLPQNGGAAAAGIRIQADPGRGAFYALIAALVAAAWITLWLWSASPYARFLEHGRWSDIGALAPICAVVFQGELVIPALLYAAGWVLMIAAMMLPTTLPILGIFRRISAGRPHANRLLALVVCGYLLAWVGYGVAAHAADWLLHLLAQHSSWLTTRGWIVGAAVLAGAGLFQFSALKYRCLDKCRTPLGFVIQRWRGISPSREALRLGFDHGLFCVGCCWALMLLMFVLGAASIGWMLALAAIMAAEKNLPGGRRLSMPLGAALIAVSAGLVVVQLWPAAA
jgi:predicted metal-binding membrane protein